MNHFATPEYWFHLRRLPPEPQALAHAKFQLLKSDPRHPSLRLKKIGRFWSVRIGLRYRALAKENEGGCFGFGLGGTMFMNKFCENNFPYSSPVLV